MADFMDIKDALQKVIDMARKVAQTPEEKTAIATVEDMAVNQFDDDLPSIRKPSWEITFRRRTGGVDWPKTSNIIIDAQTPGMALAEFDEFYEGTVTFISIRKYPGSMY